MSANNSLLYYSHSLHKHIDYNLYEPRSNTLLHSISQSKHIQVILCLDYKYAISRSVYLTTSWPWNLFSFIRLKPNTIFLYSSDRQHCLYSCCPLTWHLTHEGKTKLPKFIGWMLYQQDKLHVCVMELHSFKNYCFLWRVRQYTNKLSTYCLVNMYISTLTFEHTSEQWLKPHSSNNWCLTNIQIVLYFTSLKQVPLYNKQKPCLLKHFVIEGVLYWAKTL